MTVIIETNVRDAGDDELLAELERRRLVGDRLLRACKPGTIAAELVWRATRPATSTPGVRPWRPFLLTHPEAPSRADGACTSR